MRSTTTGSTTTRSTPTLLRLATTLALAPLAACSLAGHQEGMNGPAAGSPSAELPVPATSAGAGTPAPAAPVDTAPATSADANKVTLRPGQQIRLPDGVGLRYLRLVNDSRCAPDVQCIWAGDAQIAMQWTAAEGSRQAFALHTGQTPRDNAFGAHRVTLVSLARGPAPAAQLRLDRQDPPG